MNEQTEMPPETLKALQESIEHWERLASGQRGKNESIYGNDCALCAVFYHEDYDDDDNCENCPVWEKTGKPICAETPWLKVRDAFVYKGYQSQEFKISALEQLAFLKSLLPKATK